MIIIGGSYRPGDVPHEHLYMCHAVELPVMAGQVIARGDIVTLSGQAGPGEPGCAIRAESVGETGDARNWGDVSRGAYMALHGSGNAGGARGERRVRVMPASGEITTLLDDGIPVGALVGVDLRIDDGTSRADRDAAVARTHCPPDGGNAGRLWQRSRLIPRDKIHDPVMRRALLGRVVEILPKRDGPYTNRSQHNDCAIVRRA